jgi:hypothetical protein
LFGGELQPFRGNNNPNMMTTTRLAAVPLENRWDALWHSSVGHWLLTKGLHIVLVVLFALVTTRVIRWAATRISRRLDQTHGHDAVVRSESVKHRPRSWAQRWVSEPNASFRTC